MSLRPSEDGSKPSTATETLNLYAFKSSFVELNFGYSSVLAVAPLVITMAISTVLLRLRTERRNETTI